MDRQFSVNTIAEAVILWENEIVPDYYFQDESFDDQVFEHLNILVMAVYNFVNVFEVEFEQIFSEHFDGNVSEEQFLNIMDPRIKLLSQVKGYFGYILPCAFVREIMYRLFEVKHSKITSNGFHFVALARKLLAKFLESKFKESEADNSWPCLLNYCVEINEKFFELRRCKDSPYWNERFSVDFMHETSSGTENTELDLRTTVDGHANQLFKCDKIEINTKDKFASADACMKGTINQIVHINGESTSKDEYSEDNFLCRKNSSKIVYHSKAVSAIFLEIEEQREVDEHYIIEDVMKSKSTSVKSLNIETDLGIDDELDEIYDILMPDIEFRHKVFNLIEECVYFLDRPDNEVVYLKPYKIILSHL